MSTATTKEVNGVSKHQLQVNGQNVKSTVSQPSPRHKRATTLPVDINRKLIRHHSTYSPYDQNSYNRLVTNKRAWLSAETTIEEIDVNQQYFIIEGYFTVFWQDKQFDPNNELKKLNLYEPYPNDLLNYYLSIRINETPSTESKAVRLQYVNEKPKEEKKKDDEENKYQQDNKYKEGINDMEIDTKSMFQVISRKREEKDKDGNIEKEHDQRYIKLSKIMHIMRQKYSFPFVPSLVKDDQLILFKNAIEYELIGAKPVDLDYNLDYHAFKLRIQFRAELYESFENNHSEFPFEWQFLNAQIPYRMDEYSFESKLPDFVKNAFCFDNYWEGALSMWQHAILARKRENIGEWKLLRPWIDLRKKRQEYNYEFPFGLIKYRVRRNPHYYMLEIIVPLLLMVLCVFIPLLPAWDGVDIDSKLTYIITLLLAVAAFQISIKDGLPYKSQFTMIDEYFLLAYLIIVGMVLEQSFEERLHEDDADELWYLNIFVGGGMFVLWMVHSMTFIFKYLSYFSLSFSFNCSKSKDWKKCFNFCSCGIGRCCKALCVFVIDKGCCKNCKRRKKKDRLTKWMEMDKMEASSWDTTKKLTIGSEKAELILGTKEGTKEGGMVVMEDSRKRRDREQYDKEFRDFRKEIVEKLNKEEDMDGMRKKWCWCGEGCLCCKGDEEMNVENANYQRLLSTQSI